ncbi:MAG: type IX secretion system protein PorQ [Edaphocola sp.]
MKKSVLLGLACMGIGNVAGAQVNGGQHAFEYLRMSNSPHVSALGGLVPAAGDDVSFALQNPGLLKPAYHNQLAANYNLYYAGIGIANLQYAYHVAPLNTNFGVGIQYLNYGNFTHTDAQGNDLGNVRATDYSMNFSASRQYTEHWRYGATVKWAHSFLADRSAMAVLADVGVVYEDTAKKWVVGIVAKNMGVMLKQYNPENDAEPLPFDLQIGVSKQLQNVPLRLFVAGHHLYEWNVRYDNPADKVSNNIFGNEDTATDKKYIADKIFRHLNFGAELLLGKRLTVSAAYSHMRRSELAAGDAKGMAGFSFGVGLNLNKIHVRFARSYYATAGAYNELGFSFQLNKFFNIGNKAEPWGWNKSY